MLKLDKARAWAAVELTVFLKARGPAGAAAPPPETCTALVTLPDNPGSTDT